MLILAAIVFRGWFFLAWEEAYFDSDQAIVGLMAKHLSERRTFPLFFYGQDYMLAVESWLAAPVFALFGPSVASLRATLILINVATAWTLIWLLVKEARLGLWTAVLASSPFWMAPFITAAHLVEAQGGNAETFLWILGFWGLRRSPWWLGVALGVAFLHREFTSYAIPVLVAIQAAEGKPMRSLASQWVRSAATFAAVLLVVIALKPHADLMGPGTAGTPAMTAGSTLSLLIARADVDLHRLPARFAALVTDHLPVMMGLRRFEPLDVSIRSEATVGWDLLLAPVFGLALASAMAWSLHWVPRRRWPAGSSFAVYLAAVGAIAACVYFVTRDLSMGTFRYGLLALFMPIGIGALLLSADSPRSSTWPAALALILLSSSAAVDHLAVLSRSATRPPPKRLRAVADYLTQRHITVAEAGYWRAYALTFLTGERVRVASTFSERILEYRRLADEQGSSLVVVSDAPCDGERVASWYICRKQ
jgi:hypothetical protein